MKSVPVIGQMAFNVMNVTIILISVPTGKRKRVKLCKLYGMIQMISSDVVASNFNTFTTSIVYNDSFCGYFINLSF